MDRTAAVLRLLRRYVATRRSFAARTDTLPALTGIDMCPVRRQILDVVRGNDEPTTSGTCP